MIIFLVSHLDSLYFLNAPRKTCIFQSPTRKFERRQTHNVHDKNVAHEFFYAILDKMNDCGIAQFPCDGTAFLSSRSVY